MSSQAAVLNQCFETLASADIDIAGPVYKKYLAAMPEVAEHIECLDDRMRGRMLDQVYRLLLDDVHEDYLTFETVTHRCYGATNQRYQGLLEAVKNSVKEALGESWSAEMEHAWSSKIESIIEDIKQIEAVF